ncbi:MAG: hypothetical protein HY362_04395 [Candidatus Aenigmarchaeota archaeon]|nr:hypothetical protein [Candidatus Aenigmarchaeota archaeon]
MAIEGFLLPVRFYGYDSVIYLVSALIGLAIAYKAYKLYSVSEKNQHYNLFVGFSILAVGLLTISLTSAYSYLKFFEQKELLLFNGYFDVADVGYWIYFGASFLAYWFLINMYAPDKKGVFLLSLPMTFNYYSYLNVGLFFFALYLAFRSAVSYFSNKNQNGFWVMGAFVLMAVYHAVLLFTPFFKGFYILAHVSLILSFAFLLYMLIRVNRE